MKIIGHAGARGIAAPNTLKGIAKALEHNVDEIEFDVRVTADHQPVLLHDEITHDAAGERIVVAASSLDELRNHIPDLATLDEAIVFVDQRVPLYIEIKTPTELDPIIDSIKSYLRRGWSTTSLKVGSYNQTILETIHKELPQLQLIVIEDWSSIRAISRARKLGTNQIAMLEYWLWPGFIRAMYKRGYQLYCFRPFDSKGPFREWLYKKVHLIGYANYPVNARKWVRYGLAGVITDYPDLYEDRNKR